MDGKTDVLIVGTGFAGAATAFHLSSDFDGSIWIVDKEKLPGYHASGRNASLLLQATETPAIRELAAASRRAYETHSQEIGFQQNGSLLLGTVEQLERVREPALIASEFRSAGQVSKAIPALEGHAFEAALWTPSDGVIDISRLLDFYLEGARRRGTRVHLDTEILAVEGSGPFRVSTSNGLIEAGILVNAGGAWASEVASLAGIQPPPLFPMKRHLFLLDGVPASAPESPFVWNLAAHFYFRPESGGLLFSICDEERTASLEPTVSSEVSEALAELIWKQLPALQEAVQRKVWSCFRTKTLDDHFVIGWEPDHPAFFWVVGLGGHGMGCSWQAGLIAANALRTSNAAIPPSFLPARPTLQAARETSAAKSP